MPRPAPRLAPVTIATGALIDMAWSSALRRMDFRRRLSSGARTDRPRAGSVQVAPAVYAEGVPGDVVSVVRRQERHGGGDVLGAAGSLHRCSRGEAFQVN